MADKTCRPGADEAPGQAPLEQEARDFDRHMTERLAQGFVPDLRRAAACDWFVTNSWRRPAFVEQDQAAMFRRVHRELERRLGPGPLRILEVGCGPGYMALELARHGHHVTGLDVSPVCVDTARRMADEDPWRDGRGSLDYLTGDFFTAPGLEPGAFKAVLFVGSLHHFPDPVPALDRALELLEPGGAVVAHEPTRDTVGPGAALVLAGLRSLLSLAGCYAEGFDAPDDAQGLEQRMEAVRRELLCLDAGGAKVQSAMDNESGHQAMEAAFRARLRRVEARPVHAVFHELVGGLRMDPGGEARMARFLKDFDRALVDQGVLPATERLYSGLK